MRRICLQNHRFPSLSRSFSAIPPLLVSHSLKPINVSLTHSIPHLQGLIRRFKHVIEDRIQNSASFDASKYHQKAWSGADFSNLKWAEAHGDGRIYRK
jgi:hypothetical protein